MTCAVGVTHVVNVSRECSAPTNTNIKYLYCRAADDDACDLSTVFDEAFNFIEQAEVCPYSHLRIPKIYMHECVRTHVFLNHRIAQIRNQKKNIQN